MANVEMLHHPKNTDRALIKIQHLCEGLADLLERMEKHRDRIRGVDHTGLEAMPREKPGTGLPSNVDMAARLLAKCDQTFHDLEEIF